MIAAVGQDHAQLRLLVYEFARSRLRQGLYSQFEQLGWSGIAAQVLALEAAIVRVEAECVNHALLGSRTSEAAFIREEHPTHTALVPRQESNTALIFGEDDPYQPPQFLISPNRSVQHTLSLSPAAEHDDRSVTQRYTRQSRLTFRWNIQLIAAAVLGLAIYAATDGRSALALLGFHRFAEATSIAPANVSKGDRNIAAGNEMPGPKAVSRLGIPNIPLPSAYGLYALSNGQLTELDLLPIKVPDPRVALSAAISTPSRAHLPAGQLQFVVYRRDLASDAPDRVAMRVVAQVVRALTFDATGKPKITNVEGSWMVRSNSYQMRVAPVPDNSEMIVIRAEHADFLFPAGRYALVLKGVAYDFTLDGPMTDTAHCLERTDALNAPIYTECRTL
jgi:hypothetical protein